MNKDQFLAIFNTQCGTRTAESQTAASSGKAGKGDAGTALWIFTVGASMLAFYVLVATPL